MKALYSSERAITPAWKTVKLTPSSSATPKYTQITLTRAGTPRKTLM